MIVTSRNWALRLSVIINICVFLYVCTYHGSWRRGDPLAGDAGPLPQRLSDVQDTKPSEDPALNQPKLTINTSDSQPHKGITESSPVHFVKKEPIPPLVQPPTKKHAIRCNDKTQEPQVLKRGDYWVFYNYVPMTKSVNCSETLTYTTHADFTFLDNLEPLLARWKAPMSLALHAPGYDFQATVESIKYLRNCGSSLISEFVTFHLYFGSLHVPQKITPSDQVINATYDCSEKPPWANPKYTAKMYKNSKTLLYPVNVGRNIARESAVTQYLLASDIELYPSPGLPAKFLDMIERHDQPILDKPNPRVFVLPIFEVSETSLPPTNKTLLMAMLKSGSAIPFHAKVCPNCHRIPKGKEWQAAPETEGLHVFHANKRTGVFYHWEPIFIGTNSDPWYDERLTWDGMSDKMTQGYALCVLDYNFLILDNAFLVHRPGIKVFKKDARRQLESAKTQKLIKVRIFPEMKAIYGVRKGCTV